MKPRGGHGKAIAMLIVATACWGLSFPLIKAIVLVEAGLLPHAPGGFLDAGILAPRFILAVPIVLAGVCWGRRRGDAGPLITRSEFRQGLWVGGFSTVGMLFQNDGLRFTAASTSAFLTQFYVVTIPLWLVLRNRHWPRWTVWASCLLVLAGVAILGHFDWRHLRLGRGETDTLISALFFTGQILSLDQEPFRENRPGPMTLVMFSVEAVVFGVLGLATAPAWSVLGSLWLSPAWAGFTFVLASACTVAAFAIMNAWQPRITATEAGLIYCAEPIFGTLLSLFLPAWFSGLSGVSYANERATFALLVGGGLITAANLLLQLTRSPS